MKSYNVCNDTIERMRAKDIVADGFEGLPLSRLVDARRELTALVKSELYGAGNKFEGRAALSARASLDEFFFDMNPDLLVAGNQEDLVPLRRAIVLETLAEKVSLLDEALARAKDAKAAMLDLLSDPDRFDRFDDQEKARIREISGGTAWLAGGRLKRLHEDIRRGAVPYLR